MRCPSCSLQGLPGSDADLGSCMAVPERAELLGGRESGRDNCLGHISSWSPETGSGYTITQPLLPPDLALGFPGPGLWNLLLKLHFLLASEAPGKCIPRAEAPAVCSAPARSFNLAFQARASCPTPSPPEDFPLLSSLLSRSALRSPLHSQLSYQRIASSVVPRL